MAETPSPPEPQICRIVIYRNRAGVDMPAIITALTDDPDYVHLTLFPPPGYAPDVLSHQYGTPRAHAGEPETMLTGCWRWPEGPSAADAINAALEPNPALDELITERTRAEQLEHVDGILRKAAADMAPRRAKAKPDTEGER